MSLPTLYWHDYETFGADPRRDRPAQFAGIRTDGEFNAIGEPLVVYCKLSDDYLPHPEACLLTGITPQLVNEKGLCEAEFVAVIHRQMAQAGTCTLGYNTLRFDDEVTRNLLYRNFYDPYAREWQNGNSRWDLIDWVRTARALRPEGIVWPDHEDGRPSFKLEDLTAANGIEHSGAHDALADVRATIELAKLLKNAQPKLYRFLFEGRGKQAVLEGLKLGSMTPVLHVSGMYPSLKGNLAVVLPLCKHPTNNNGVLVYDLSVDPEPLLSLNADAVRQRLFTANTDLPEAMDRIPLKTVHINKCPVIVPISALREQDLQRWAVDLPSCRRHAAAITTSAGLGDKLREVFKHTFEPENDPDFMLYSGGFFAPDDKRIMENIRSMPPQQLAEFRPRFIDARLPEMFFRYCARNYPEILDDTQRNDWKAFCVKRLTDKHGGAGPAMEEYLQLLETQPGHGHNAVTLQLLRDYARQLAGKLGLSTS
ncbi:MAG: exodeoxyribonuclease I [Gammaproteobacteria bacterium]